MACAKWQVFKTLQKACRIRANLQFNDFPEGIHHMIIPYQTGPEMEHVSPAGFNIMSRYNQGQGETVLQGTGSKLGRTLN